jgi:hypothetical protein
MTEQKSVAELAAEANSEDTRSFVRRVKRATRRRYTPEEKVRWKRPLRMRSGGLKDRPGGPR